MFDLSSFLSNFYHLSPYVKNTRSSLSSQKNIKRSRISGSMKLRLIIDKLQKGLSLLATKGPHDDNDEEFDEDVEIAKKIPEDVKEGHFAVFAVKGKETKRFVVKLESLNNPAFLKLLEQAKEEYGFEQKGALAVPCRPEDLHKILENRREKSKTSATINNTHSNTQNLIEGY
ncbi:auxin-responsive protein SAUR50 [Argentina anserina]|uniref:auxin-responsive protein SAUR50 n=1 Tax=Argentina anserina TaxID=57926 RepID=UPI0021762469|nr:auxin-responsive protein SAUR50 [Potentilla anserina]